METKIAIFCGTGGVGKTTLSASYALSLAFAHPHKKILLITIDPSQRLKDFFLQKEYFSTPPLKTLFAKEYPNSENNLSLLLSTPSLTFQKMALMSKQYLEKEMATLFETNFILKKITSPFGGMSELTGMMDLFLMLQSHQYDFIVLDTPPGKHFIDFLTSSKKINQFFENKVFELLKEYYLKNSKEPSKKSVFSSLKKIVDLSIGKIFEGVKQLTGDTFLKDLIEAISLLKINAPFFLQALEVEKILKSPEQTLSFFVTSAKHFKTDDLINFYEEAKEYFLNSTFILNRSEEFLNKENKDTHDHKKITQYLSYLENLETLAISQLKDYIPKEAHNLVIFKETNQLNLTSDLLNLVKQWDSSGIPQRNVL